MLVQVPMFIATLSTIATVRSQAGQWTHKTWSIHTMDCYPALKRKGILTPATWMNLEDITFNEINQSRKNKYCRIPLV